MGKAKIDRHLRNKSNNNPSGKKDKFFCQWCKTTFASFEKHYKHICLPNRCSSCSKSFKEELELTKHKSRDHDNVLSRSMKATGGPLPERLHLRADHVSPDGRRSCEMCKKNLRGRRQVCTNCVSIPNKGSYGNLSDEYGFISSSTLSDSNHNSPLFDKTTTTGSLQRCSRRMSSSNSSEVSRCSDSTEVMETEDAAHAISNAKRDSLSVLLGITAAHGSLPRRSRRMGRFRSDSSEMSRHSESLVAENADVKKEACVTSPSKNIMDEKVSRNRHKRRRTSRFHSDSSEMSRHSESLDAEDADVINDKEESSIFSSPNKSVTDGKVYKNQHKTHRMSRFRSDSSEISRGSESLDAENADVVNDKEETSITSSPITDEKVYRNRHKSSRTNRFRSDSSEISRHSDSLNAEDANVINDKEESSIISSPNKSITDEKVSMNQHEMTTIRSDSSDIYSESSEAQNTEDVSNDDVKDKETNDAANTKEKETTKSVLNKTAKSENLSWRIRKRSGLSSNTSNVAKLSESVEPLISEDPTINGFLDAVEFNGTELTEPLLNETAMVKNIDTHNHKKDGKPFGNSEISNKTADPLDIQKSGYPISPDVVNSEPVKKPMEQHEKEETVTENESNKTVTKSSKPMDKSEMPVKSGNGIFCTKKIMPQKPDLLLTSENQEHLTLESNTNGTASMSMKSLEQGGVITVDVVGKRPSSEQPIDQEGETAAVSEVKKPASVLTKPKHVGHSESDQSRRERNASTSVGRVGRKRNLESEDGNSVSPSRNKSDGGEEHARRRISKKIINVQIDIAPAVNMVQIDTLIRSLPDDSGILLKPCGKDDSNFKCPKCNKVFRNPKLGSFHYSICPKNIELSKNRKTLVSPHNVVWVCSLCHIFFNQHSELTEHKKICLLPMSSKNSFRSSLIGDEYKSSCMKCPKCCYQCRSLITFQNHPCKKNLEKMQSCAIAMNKLPALYVNGRGNFQYFECHQCKRPFFDEHSFKEHLQLHPAAQSRESIKTLNVNSGYPATQIKAELISIDDDEYANDEMQSTSNGTRNGHALNSDIPFPRPRNQSPLTNSLHSRVSSSNHRRESANNSHMGTFFSPSSPFLNPLDTSRMPGSQPAETQAREIFAEGFFSSTQAKELSFHLMDRGICLHRTEPVPPGEDVKPCMRCLDGIIDPDVSHNGTTVKQEKPETVRSNSPEDDEEDALEIDEAPLDLDIPNPVRPNHPIPVHPDLDLGLSLGYGNSEVALQLMKDINAIQTPLTSHRFLTPPATPDRSNVQSPTSLCSAPKEYHAQSGDRKAGPSGSNNSHSLNDLVSISLDKPFTTSEGFIANFNEDAQSDSVTSLSVVVNGPAAPEPALMADELGPIADEPIPFVGEPGPIVGEFGPLADEPISMVNVPGLMAEEPVPMLVEPMPIAVDSLPLVDEPAAQESLPPLERPLPTVRHTHIPFGNLVADAFAMIPNEDSETVGRYICRHCLLSFQLDTLMTHMHSVVGKPTTEDIIAVYVPV